MNKYKPKAFVLVYVALIAIVFFSWIITRSGDRAKAAGEVVAFTYTPTSGTFNVNEVKELDVIVQTSDAAKKLSGIDLTFKSNGVVNFTDISAVTQVGSTDTSLFNEIIKTVQNNQIHISYVSLKPDAELPFAVKFKISFKGTADGQGQIMLDTTNSQIVGNVTGKVYTPADQVPLNFTFGSGLTGPAVSLHVLPPSFQVTVGQEQQMTFLITDTPAGKGISGFSATITYDPLKLEVTNLGAPYDSTTNGDAQKFTMLRKDHDPVAGTIRIAYVSTLASDQLPREPAFPFTVKGKQDGSGSIAISTQEVTGNIVENVYTTNTYGSTYTVGTTGGSVTPIPSPTTAVSITPGISITPGGCTNDTQCASNQSCAGNVCREVACVSTNTCITGVVANHACTFNPVTDGTACTGGQCQAGVCVQQQTGNIRLNIKTRFQGILVKPVGATTMQVKVSIGGGQLGNQILSKVGTFTVNDQSIWSGTVAFNAPAGGGYKVTVKGPQHLQKKICVMTPVETSMGTYRCGDQGSITFVDGDNNLDYSQILLLTGDLPEQDGVVDAYDISYLRQSLLSSDPRAVSIADLNKDGIVDTQDYSLLIAALSVKYDDEL